MQFPDSVEFKTKMKSTIFLVTYIVMGISKGSNACNDGWEDASSVDLGYLWFENTTMDYSEAVTFCSDKQAQLVEIETEDQLSYLRNKLKIFSVNVAPISLDGFPAKPFWGGATKEGGNDWRWTNSREKVQDFVWGEGALGIEDKLCFIDWLAYKGADISGDYRFYLVCQQKMYDLIHNNSYMHQCLQVIVLYLQVWQTNNPCIYRFYQYHRCFKCYITWYGIENTSHSHTLNT